MEGGAADDDGEFRHQQIHIRKKQVLRQFNKLFPLCDALRDNFRAHVDVKTDEKKQSEETNALFGEGHALINNAPLQYSRRNQHNLADRNTLIQGHRYNLDDLPIDWSHYDRDLLLFSPFVRSSTTLTSKRATPFSRIDSCANRMKSRTVQNKVASEVSRHLVDNVEHHGDHIEFFFRTMQSPVADDAPGALKLPQPVQKSRLNFRRRSSNASNISSSVPVKQPQQTIDTNIFQHMKSSLSKSQSPDAKPLLRRPVANILTSSLPTFDLEEGYRGRPLGSVKFEEQAYDTLFPGIMKTRINVPHDQTETPVRHAIKQLPPILARSN